MSSRDQQEGGSDTLVLPDYAILFGILVCFAWEQICSRITQSEPPATGGGS